jgi:hypothetical protein
MSIMGTPMLSLRNVCKSVASFLHSVDQCLSNRDRDEPLSISLQTGETTRASTESQATTQTTDSNDTFGQKVAKV